MQGTDTNAFGITILGAVGVDLLSIVNSFPEPDQKIRCVGSEVGLHIMN